MKLSLKVILGFWIGLILVIVGLLYGAYLKLEPKSFITLLNEEAQRNYPGSQLIVKSIDYGFSVDFSLRLKNIELIRATKTLAHVGEVEVKVPWWLLVFNRGNAQVGLKDLTIFVESSPTTQITRDGGGGFQKKTSSIKIPNYLSDAHYTLRAKNISIKDSVSLRRYFTVSKLLVREFQYGKNSAFEVNIPIEINHRRTNYNSELWLFGDVTPNVDHWDLNYRGEFKTRETTDKFHIDDLVIDGKASLDPVAVNFKSTIGLSIEKTVVGSGEATGKSTALHLDLFLEKLPLSYLTLVGEEVRNPYLGNLEGTAQGFVKFIKSFDRETPSHLNGKLSFDGEFFIDSQNKFPGKWQLTFENTKWETSFLSPKGEVSYFRRAFVDFKKGSLAQYAQELGFNGVDAKMALLSVPSLDALANSSIQPFFSTLVSLKKCLEGDKHIDGTFRFGISPEEKYYHVNLNGEGSFQLDYLKKPESKQVDASFSKFSWRPYFKFLDPFFTAESGILDGKISGRWINMWNDGRWLVVAKGSGIIDAKGNWQSLNQQLLNQFELDLATTQEVSWNISMLKNNVRLTSLSLNSGDPAIISGQLNSDLKQKSFLVLSHPKNKKWKPVKKEIKDLFWNKEF